MAVSMTTMVKIRMQSKSQPQLLITCLESNTEDSTIATRHPDISSVHIMYYYFISKFYEYSVSLSLLSMSVPVELLAREVVSAIFLFLA